MNSLSGALLAQLFGTFELIFEVICGSWGHFEGTVGSLLVSETAWGTKSAPRAATPEINSPIWRPCGALVSNIFDVFVKQTLLKYVPSFLQFLGRPERSTGWAHMQSVHAGAVQTHTFPFSQFF